MITFEGAQSSYNYSNSFLTEKWTPFKGFLPIQFTVVLGNHWTKKKGKVEIQMWLNCLQLVDANNPK